MNKKFIAIGLLSLYVLYGAANFAKPVYASVENLNSSELTCVSETVKEIQPREQKFREPTMSDEEKEYWESKLEHKYRITEVHVFEPKNAYFANVKDCNGTTYYLDVPIILNDPQGSFVSHVNNCKEKNDKIKEQFRDYTGNIITSKYIKIENDYVLNIPTDERIIFCNPRLYEPWAHIYEFWANINEEERNNICKELAELLNFVHKKHSNTGNTLIAGIDFWDYVFYNADTKEILVTDLDPLEAKYNKLPSEFEDIYIDFIAEDFLSSYRFDEIQNNVTAYCEVISKTIDYYNEISNKKIDKSKLKRIYKHKLEEDFVKCCSYIMAYLFEQYNELSEKYSQIGSLRKWDAKSMESILKETSKYYDDYDDCDDDLDKLPEYYTQEFKEKLLNVYNEFAPTMVLLIKEELRKNLHEENPKPSPSEIDAKVDIEISEVLKSYSLEIPGQILERIKIMETIIK